MPIFAYTTLIDDHSLLVIVGLPYNVGISMGAARAYVPTVAIDFMLLNFLEG